MLIITLDLQIASSDISTKKVTITPKMITIYHQISLISLKRQLVLTEITFAPEIKCFQKFHELTNKSYETRIKWITKTVKQLFKPKSRNLHSACVLYERVCVFEKNIH